MKTGVEAIMYILLWGILRQTVFLTIPFNLFKLILPVLPCTFSLSSNATSASIYRTKTFSMSQLYIKLKSFKNILLITIIFFFSQVSKTVILDSIRLNTFFLL